MAKTKSFSRLGISLGGEALQVAEIQHAGNRSEILGLISVPLEYPFSYRTLSIDSEQDDIATLLRQAIDDAGMNSTQVVVSVDSSMALVKRLPYDHTLSAKDIQSHIPWELEQYLLSPREDYVFDFQSFTKNNGEKAPHFIMVAVKKPIIETIQHIVQTADLELAVIDVDVLAAANAFETNYSMPLGEFSALVEVGTDKLTFSFLNGHTFLGHHSVYLEDIDDTESLGKEISRNLRIFASDFLADDRKRQFDHVYLYRPSPHHNLEALIATSTLQHSETLNPFASLELAEDVEDAFDLNEDTSQYTEAIGLALRK